MRARAVREPSAVAAVLAAVEAIYANGGPAPRTTHDVVAPDGTLRFRMGGLFMECVVCGFRQPQSRSRQSPEARRLWVEMHLRCPE